MSVAAIWGESKASGARNMLDAFNDPDLAISTYQSGIEIDESGNLHATSTGKVTDKYDSCDTSVTPTVTGDGSASISFELELFGEITVDKLSIDLSGNPITSPVTYGGTRTTGKWTIESKQVEIDPNE